MNVTAQQLVHARAMMARIELDPHTCTTYYAALLGPNRFQKKNKHHKEISQDVSISLNGYKI